ncbi:hypothetical protein MHU86_9154 [Fragilaria crotonensis]|nr:hypothetical protein MHU86_9154 [Fragilaria crotonensis]
MEFTIVILQLAAVVTTLEENQLQPSLATKFPRGIPALAKLLIRTDNSPSQNWAHKVSSRSEKGQQLVHLYAALLERTSIAVACNHIKGGKQFPGRFYFTPTNSHTVSGLAPPTDIREGAETRILSLFPPSSRTFIQPGVQAVQRAMERNHNSAKTARTIRSRRIHYFIFCHTLNLDDDWTLANQPQERANYQLALYATHLATGSSLHCKSLKASTIASYLLDVAKFLGRYRDVDPRFRSTADTRLAPAIAKVLDEQKRWESVPNRREPFTLEMHKYIAQSAATQADDCCIEAALANWTLCNLYAGCRGIEWMQTNSTNQLIHSHHLNRFGNAYAFTLRDVNVQQHPTNY